MYSFSPEHFAHRRRRLIERIGDDAVAVFVGGPEATRSHDTSYPYRPASDVLYLTGFREPQAVVVIAPGHDEGDFAMFVRKRDEEAEMWDGRRAGPEGAVADWGADVAYALDELDDKLPGFLKGRQTLYYTLGARPEFDERVTRWMNELRHRRREPSAAPAALRDARDVLHELRLRKTAEEIEVMRQAVRISGEAHVLAMRHCKPGMHEYELQALIEYHFRKNGAEFPAYTTIVGSGANATVLHYVENRGVIGADDVVLVDAGAEFGFYAGDITRSFPASGRFTGAQRDVYQAVLDCQEALVDMIAPGVIYNELQDTAVRLLSEAMVELGLIDASVDQVIDEELYKGFYPHSVGHWLGIDVHDVGPYYTDAGDWRPLEPGMVLTIEPGLYIRQQAEGVPDAMRGVGVRIEDDILVTEDGYENLSHDCPKQADEIEALVGTAG